MLFFQNSDRNLNITAIGAFRPRLPRGDYKGLDLPGSGKSKRLTPKYFVADRTRIDKSKLVSVSSTLPAKDACRMQVEHHNDYTTTRLVCINSVYRYAIVVVFPTVVITVWVCCATFAMILAAHLQCTKHSTRLYIVFCTFYIRRFVTRRAIANVSKLTQFFKLNTYTINCCSSSKTKKKQNKNN